MTPSSPHALTNLHRFLIRHSFYPLVFSSLFAVALIVVRVSLMKRPAYGFLVWNLFLAWIPYGSALLLDAVHRFRPQRTGWQVAFGIAWLLFFPNAPYIVTDFLYFQQILPLTWWYDLVLLLTFSWTGCFLAVVSLRIVHLRLEERIGAVRSWLFALAVIGLSGFGIYLGRFLRWNSWDILTRPEKLLMDVVAPFLDPFGHKRAIAVTILFGAFLFICYITFLSRSLSESTVPDK
jgi:uncharacterized membrane protein